MATSAQVNWMESLKAYFTVSLEQELERSSILRTEDIVEIQQWMSTQLHLPLSPDILVAHFLLASMCDIELAKKVINLNFVYKKSMSAFFDEWDPLSVPVQVQAKQVMYFAALPKQSASHPRLCFTRYKEHSAFLYDFVNSTKWFLMSFQSILFLEGQQEFNFVLDVAPLTWTHAIKSPYRLLRQYYAYFSNAAPIRITGVHFINTNSVIRKMASFFRMFISSSNFKKVHFYESSAEYFDSIPPGSVPQDYGGTGPSLESLHEENTTRVIEARKALKAFCDLK